MTKSQGPSPILDQGKEPATDPPEKKMRPPSHQRPRPDSGAAAASFPFGLHSHTSAMAKGDGSSAYKNAVPRRTHKERAQSLSRQRSLGLLEKHSDYKLRADSYNKKKSALLLLTEKARNRNPDEFYMAMQSSRTSNGVHVSGVGGAPKRSESELLLLRTQDERYLRSRALNDNKRARQIREGLSGVNAPGASSTNAANKHTIFVDSEKQLKQFDAAAHFQTTKAALTRTHNRRRVGEGDEEKDEYEKQASRDRKRVAYKYNEASRLEARAKQVSSLADELAFHKMVHSKGRKRKLRAGDVGSTGDGATTSSQQRLGTYKWKKVRRK